MENSKFNQIEDIRQSEGWENFLKWTNWECERTSNGTLVALSKSPVGMIGKVQRPQNMGKSSLDEIDTICKKNRCSVLKFEPSFSQDLELLENSGYKQSFRPLLPPATIIIDLSKSEKDIWKDVSRSGKYSVNRARREGAEIEIHPNPSKKALKRFLTLTDETRKDRNYTGASKADLETKANIFGKDMHLIFVKDKKGKDLVGNMYFTHKDSVWYLNGGTSAEARKTKAGYALVWESILYFKNNGIQFMDFDGVDDDRFPGFTRNWGQFSHFKEKFSREKILFPTPYVKIYNPALKLLTKLRGKNTL